MISASQHMRRPSSSHGCRARHSVRTCCVATPSPNPLSVISASTSASTKSAPVSGLLAFTDGSCEFFFLNVLVFVVFVFVVFFGEMGEKGKMCACKQAKEHAAL